MRIISFVKSVFNRYRDIIAYLFFGACSMLANIAAYYACYHVIGFSNVCSTAIAWLVAVLVAFITNKLWVFGSKTFAANVLARELLSFFSCRIATGLLDVGIMYVAVDCLAGNEILWKIIANIIVIVLNYVASKLVIFKRND